MPYIINSFLLKIKLLLIISFNHKKFVCLTKFSLHKLVQNNKCTLLSLVKPLGILYCITITITSSSSTSSITITVLGGLLVLLVLVGFFVRLLREEGGERQTDRQ